MTILIEYLKKYRWLFFLALSLAAINQVFSLLSPWIFQQIIDNYIVDEKGRAIFENFTTEAFLKGIMFWICMDICTAMVSRIAKNFQDYFVNVITQRLGADVYTDGIRHSLKLPYSVFEDQRSGETLGKLQKTRTDIEKLISMFVSVLFTTLIGVVFVFIYAVKIHWMLPVVYFGAVPLLGFISSYLSKKIKNIQKKIVSETTSLAGSTTESLRNIELVKSLGLANQEIGRLNSITFKILNLELKKVRYIRSIGFIQGTIVNFLRNLILFLLMWMIFRHQMQVGQLFAMQIYSFFIFGPLQELGNIISTYREAEVSLSNFTDLLKTPVEKTPDNPPKLERINHFEFKNVSFKHETSLRDALTDISFECRIGQTIAFVGPSGSGKTTLVKLLVGLYRPVNGHINYNHYDSAVINLNDLRKQIGFVTQDTQLFAGTIRENLLFVQPDATDTECMEVLHQAACASLLARADKGLDTVIGEGGVKVSGGEKQRLSIARALLRKPNLLVFDEATSALDSITEDEIGETIRTVSHKGNHITILIAHRLSTIMHADKIFVLEKGRIIESGTHQQLVSENGLYYAMWRQQIGETNDINMN